MRWTQEAYLLSPKLISRLRYSFNNYCIRGQFDDFYHDYVVHILSGLGKHQTIDQFTIDHIRSTVGRIGQKKELLNAIMIDEKIFDEEEKESVLSPGYIRHVKELLQIYSGRTRVIVALHYIYGYENDEIGLIYGISPSRISQILTQIKSGENISVEKTPEFRIFSLENECDRLKEKLLKVYRRKSKEKVLDQE